jgi:hypothetical protein
MAHASWLVPDKQSGSGNDTVTVSAGSQNTGRNARSTQLTFKAAGCVDVIGIVTHIGKPEGGTIQGSASAEQLGGTVTITGTSNSSRLTFSKSNDNIGITLPSTYKVSGVDVNNGEAIPGDPGATLEYNFSIALTVPANTHTEARTCQITATDDAGNTYNCTLTIAAGAAYLIVSPLSIELAWDGSTTGTFTVESNTNWTVD